MSLTMYVNTGDVDNEYGESGTEFTEVNFSNDYLVFSNGSDVVADGESIPGSNELNQAGVVITDDKVIVPHYFLADYSADELKESTLAGDNNAQYVFAFSFDAATASEPVLEVWDNEDMDSIDNYCLGNGTASDSWIWGITTTTSAPGSDWIGDSPTVGSRLAGSSDGHFLELNDGNGALSSADVLYAQLKIIMPANASNSGAETPIFVIKFTSN